MGLMQYTHLDTRRWREEKKGDGEKANGAEGDVDEEEQEEEVVGAVDEPISDRLLRQVVLEDNSPVDFVFAKRTENTSKQAAERIDEEVKVKVEQDGDD